MLGYIVLGMLFLTIMAVLLGIFVSYWISLVLVVLYFIGLIIVQRVTANIQQRMEKSFLFNMALILGNINFNILEPKYKIKAKLGHLGTWVEFHSLPRRRIFSATLVNTPDNMFKRSFAGTRKMAKTY